MSVSKDELFRVAVLIDQLKHEELGLRLGATRSLTRIAELIGPDRTRKELIPFLIDSIDDEDTILIALAEEFGKLKDFVGGKEHVASIIKGLDAVLVAGDSRAVRDKAIEALATITPALSVLQVRHTLVPLFRRLVQSQWYNEICGGLDLAPILFEALASDEERSDLLASFEAAVAHRLSIVRSAAAEALARIIPHAPLVLIHEKVTPMLIALAKDQQDCVMAPNITAMILALERLGEDRATFEESFAQLLAPCLRTSASDCPSWRVRFRAASELHKVAAAYALTDDVDWERLCALVAAVVLDPEAEVRVVAVRNLPRVLGVLVAAGAPATDLVATKVLSSIDLVVSDGADFVRETVAETLADIVAALPETMALAHIPPQVLRLLKDENVDVRVKIVSRLTRLGPCCSKEEIVAPATESLEELLQEESWRVRSGALKAMPPIASLLGSFEFDSKFLTLLLERMKDRIQAVRAAAVEVVATVGREFGAEWVERKALPYVQAMRTAANHQHRLVAIEASVELFRLLPIGRASELLLPLLVGECKDGVPNLRMAAARALATLAPLVSSGPFREQIAAALDALTLDQDFDVRHQAELAMKLM
eukprot:gnl/Chilomastix_cuspidata/1338.p1 GENE.gnl/Chilomastix_cuspidata/1338~~gnl/Chilomastix_cuspidata/1338.p1  ORF type:complete len:598 (+),score=283.66 gnl/Chilomastix_cuspidata/1338:41-1834(+)